MQRSIWSLTIAFVMGGGLCHAQTTMTWQQVKDKFEADNPNLRAGVLNIQESKANEITAYLRPNPDMSVGLDQIQLSGTPLRPFSLALPLVSFDYLHERQHKRELRLESAQKGTAIAESQQQDLERTLLFSLRTAFVQVLQSKALLANAKENLEYFDKELAINRIRYKSGDIARVDLDRLVLQRVQYESDYQSALVNARTAKITLLMMLNNRTPVDQFDVAGPFEFDDHVMALDEFHTAALDARPDLKAAVQAVDKAETDHKLAVSNGSTDPTFGFDVARNPPLTLYAGFSVSIPLRIFDKNQERRRAPRSTYRTRSGRRMRRKRRYSATSIRPTSRLSVRRTCCVRIKARTGISKQLCACATPSLLPTSAGMRPCSIIWTRSGTIGPRR